MSKGKRAKFCKGSEPILTIVELPPEDGSVAAIVPDKSLCWEFNLIDTTPEAAAVKAGDPVFGLIRSGRIAVNALVGLVGFAPAGVAQRIIEAIKQSRSGDPQGTVTVKGEGTKVKVKLCL